MKKVLNVGVLGGGSFGTALGTVAARCGHNVKIFSKTEQTVREINDMRRNLRFFPEEIILPENLKASSNIGEVLDKSDMVIHAIPVQASFDFMKENYSHFPKDIPYIIASKGILLKQKKFFSQVWEDICPKNGKNIHHCVLSGPSFAIELMKNYPTVVSLGCRDHSIGQFVQQNLSNETFRTYTTTDVIGVEIGGALKNPLAIAAGVIEGRGFKYNTLSALVTRGIYEMSLFSQKFGGRMETLNGLSGIGDVMLSCLGTLSRNKSVGLKLAQGITLEDIIKNNKEVAEGVPTLLVLGEIIKEHNLNMPIMSTLHQLVKNEISIEEAGKQLMLRELEHETQMRI
jgi:glycerol-3-phosphate dehydrogenase